MLAPTLVMRNSQCFAECLGAYTAGYTRDIGVFHDTETGIGVNFTAYSLPGSIQPYYGGHPVWVNIFARFRLKPGS